MFCLRTALEIYDVLPDNYQLAVKRFDCLKRRLNKEKTILDEYNKIFNDYLNDDKIEKVDVSKDNPSVGKVHYLPHRPVIKSDWEQLRYVSYSMALPTLMMKLALMTFSIQDHV